MTRLSPSTGERVEIAPRLRSNQHPPEALAAACDLYRSGLSLRDVSQQTGINRETIRQALAANGETRKRLAYIAPAEIRIVSHIEVATNGCWIWFGNRNNMGYGMFSLNGRKMLAHRAIREHIGDPIPDGLDACHRCDTPACVNPDHIFAGTRSDNMWDASRKGRLGKKRRRP